MYKGLPICLTIVGREGWVGVSTIERQEIIDILEKIKDMQNNGMQVFWENGADDDELSTFYQTSNYYIAASYAEGFGLPLVEAASFNLPIIAREISIFEEVLGTGAMYFSSYGASKLEDIVTRITSDLNFEIEKPNATIYGWDEVASQFTNFILAKDS
jgi:glycosyltransferase involved in cell wall biosynthesis